MSGFKLPEKFSDYLNLHQQFGSLLVKPCCPTFLKARHESAEYGFTVRRCRTSKKCARVGTCYIPLSQGSKYVLSLSAATGLDHLYQED